MTTTILQGDVLERLRELPEESVHCVVTSPPYWNLRDYGVAGQIGLEDTIDAWVARMVEVFAEVRRVLRPDGTLWLNLGDSYSTGASGDKNDALVDHSGNVRGVLKKPPVKGMRTKNLIGQPWRVAFALQADGWYLRADIIWAKSNPMPESVTDRPTKSHEYVFLLTKSPRYFYDSEAVREEATTGNHHRNVTDCKRDGAAVPPGTPRHTGLWKTPGKEAGRNARTVWSIATQPYPDAHFATFPDELPRRCIAAGTSERGVCAECGAPWARILERKTLRDLGVLRDDHKTGAREDAGVQGLSGARRGNDGGSSPEIKTVGWEATCDHTTEPVAATVLDPFAGSGTTLAVALRYGRDGIGIELNPEYVELAERRIAKAERKHGTPLFQDSP